MIKDVGQWPYLKWTYREKKNIKLKTEKIFEDQKWDQKYIKKNLTTKSDM